MLEGSACHDVMEKALLADAKPPETLIGATVEGVEITQRLYYDKLVPAWEAVDEAFTRFDIGEYEPEAVVHFQSIEGAFGTCDILARGRDDLVVLLDHKFGDGVLVSPVENKQLMFYAAAATEDPAFADWFTGDLDQPIAVGIIQPAQEHVLSTWMTTVREVTAFSMSLMLAVDKGNDPDLEPRTGDWCRWCPAAPVCPAKLLNADTTALLKEEHLNDLTTAIALAADLEPWIKQVRDLVHRQLEAGAEVDGWKLVKKRAMRKWIDDADMLRTLKNAKKLKVEEYSTVKMCTPPQLEKICKAKKLDFKKYSSKVTSVSSGTTIAPEDDPREGVVIHADREIPENLAKQMKEATATA